MHWFIDILEYVLSTSNAFCLKNCLKNCTGNFFLEKSVQGVIKKKTTTSSIFLFKCKSRPVKNWATYKTNWSNHVIILALILLHEQQRSSYEKASSRSFVEFDFRVWYARSIHFFVLAVSAWLLDRDAFRPAAFAGERIGSGVSWLGGSWLRLPDADL